MKLSRTTLHLLLLLTALVAFLAGHLTKPAKADASATLSAPMMFQSTVARPNWISNQRTAINQVWVGCQAVYGFDQEYVSNGYSGTLVNGDFTGANAGILAADMVTAEGNIAAICKGVLGITTPTTIANGTATTLTKVTK